MAHSSSESASLQRGNRSASGEVATRGVRHGEAVGNLLGVAGGEALGVGVLVEQRESAATSRQNFAREHWDSRDREPKGS